MRMTEKSIRKALPAACMALLLAACSSVTPMSRIQANPALYGSLPAQHQALVQQGQICDGMGKDAVMLAWGRPDGVASGQLAGGKVWERWEYTAMEPVMTTHVGFGGWYGHRGYWPYGMGGMDTAYVPRCVGQVEFVEGRVKSWMHY